MNKTNLKLIFGFLISTFALATPSWAFLNQSWVSIGGVNVLTCGAITSPCRTFQYTHDFISQPNGTIFVRTSGDYGRLVISKPISIVNDGSVQAVIQVTSGNAIEINAGINDRVHIRGLSLEGADTADNGVLVQSGGTVELVDLKIQKFFQNGVTLSTLPTQVQQQLLIQDSYISEIGGPFDPNSMGGFNVGNGVNIAATTASNSTSIYSTTIATTYNGVVLTAFDASRMQLSVKNSNFVSNFSTGITTNTDTRLARAEVSLDNVEFTDTGRSIPNYSGFTRVAIVANPMATFYLHDCKFFNNITAVFANAGSVVYSSGTNAFFGNEADVSNRPFTKMDLQ